MLMMIKIGTKKLAVPIIIKPKNTDLVAVAPTNPIIISMAEIGAASNSYIVPLNLGKKMLKDHLKLSLIHNRRCRRIER